MLEYQSADQITKSRFSISASHLITLYYKFKLFHCFSLYLHLIRNLPKRYALIPPPLVALINMQYLEVCFVRPECTECTVVFV
jgi:hypothetical protein